MKVVLQQLLSSDIETEVLEFKEAKSQYDKNKLGKYFSALSNEANLKGKKCSWLLFGIKNNRRIIGTNINEKQINEYKIEISKQTSPSIGFVNVYNVEVESKTVLMFEIPPAPKGYPVSWKGHYYGREGESLVALSLEKIERIRLGNIVEDWSAKIIYDATIDDLSKEAITKAKSLFLTKNPKLAKEIGKWNNVQFLNKAKIAIKGKITNTAILLLGKPESEHFISPAVAKISWILRNKENIERDYEHFSPPILINSEKVFSKIRNLKYRYLQSGTFFPEEVDQYDPYIIREALNNAIAHQDYRLNGKIIVIEKEDSTLTFVNKGSFIPKTIENVIISDAPETETRNPFLVNAMLNLNMIDTIGSGIKKMFIIQKDKFFPLPEYSFANKSVKVTFNGKVIDMAYAEKIAQMPELSFNQIILLDKVQKNKQLTNDEIDELKAKKLIEGRKPNYHISVSVAKKTGQEIDYIKMKGIDDDYYMELILKYLEKFKKGIRSDFEKLLLTKLPEILSEQQKKDKVKNILQKMKLKELIKANKDRQWELK